VHVPLFDADVHVTREEFEHLARPWLERTVALTAATLFRTGLSREQLAGVVLVGGSSRIPMVATLLHQRLGVPPTVLDQPELVVAQGSLAAGPAPGGAPTLVAPAPFAAPPGEPAPPGYGQQQPGYGQQQPGFGQPPGYGPNQPGPPAGLGAPPPGGPVWPPAAAVGAPSPRKRRRGPTRVLAVVAAVVVALVLGGVAVANLGDDDEPGENTSQNSPTGDRGQIDVLPPTGDLEDGLDPSTQPPDPPETEPGQTTPPAGEATGPRILYEVLVAKPIKATTLSYHDKDGDTISYQGHQLPWRLEFTATDADFDPSITAQIAGGSGRFITCRLTIDGKLRTERTDDAKLYPTVVC
jgi:hypothetical protein